jgi:hypothetical protein
MRDDQIKHVLKMKQENFYCFIIVSQFKIYHSYTLFKFCAGGEEQDT